MTLDQEEVDNLIALLESTDETNIELAFTIIENLKEIPEKIKTIINEINFYYKEIYCEILSKTTCLSILKKDKEKINEANYFVGSNHPVFSAKKRLELLCLINKK